MSTEKTVTVRHKATGNEWEETLEQANRKNRVEYEILESEAATETEGSSETPVDENVTSSVDTVSIEEEAIPDQTPVAESTESKSFKKR